MPTNENDNRNCSNCGDDIEVGHDFVYSRGDSICWDCYDSDREAYEDEQEEDERGSILGYSAKPTTIFHHADGTKSRTPERIEHTNTNYMFGETPGIIERHKPYMGCELEAECPSNQPIHVWAKMIAENTNDLIYAKEDCTIHRGFEMVNHPMDLDYIHNHTSEWARTMQKMRQAGWRAWDASNCGFHIHLEKKSFVDAKHELKFIYFVFKNKSNMIKFSGRNSTYARYNLDAFINVDADAWRNNKPNLMEVVKGQQKNGDYVPGPYERNLAINRQNEFSHELRFFKPSLRFETILSYFEFTHALWAFTKEVKLEQVMKENAISAFDSLANFARDNRDTYPHFIERMHKRRVVSKPLLWTDFNEDK